jgi:hypothetical protein
MGLLVLGTDTHTDSFPLIAHCPIPSHPEVNKLMPDARGQLAPGWPPLPLLGCSSFPFSLLRPPLVLETG